MQNCSGFAAAEFDGVCGGCLAAVAEVKRAMMDDFGVRGDDQNENGACGFAAVVAVAAGRIGNRSDFDGLFQCLPALDTSSKLLHFSKRNKIKNIVKL